VTAPEAKRPKTKSRTSRLLRALLFPGGVLVLYLVLFAAAPAQAARALRAGVQVLKQVALPLGIAFTVMFLLNFLVKPAHIVGLLGAGAGVKGLLLSTLAGIASMGPIYAWYPLLKDLRMKGASDFHLANFLSNRAVKPFLLLVMVFYFGWTFTVTLNVLIVAGALLTGVIVSAVCARPAKEEAREPATRR